MKLDLPVREERVSYSHTDVQYGKGNRERSRGGGRFIQGLSGTPSKGWYVLFTSGLKEAPFYRPVQVNLPIPKSHVTLLPRGPRKGMEVPPTSSPGVGVTRVR